MGLFFNSDTQIKKNQILRDVAIVNDALRKVATTLDNNGMNEVTINSISSILGSIETNTTRISTTVQSMSDSQLSGFNVPWIDGRYLGIMTWMFTMITMIQQLSTEMENRLR